MGLVARKGAVIEVDRNTQPVMFNYGEVVWLERLPLGLRIVYPPDPLEPIAHPERAIKRALGRPLEDDPLKSLLRRGQQPDLALRQLSLPRPPRAGPRARDPWLGEVVDIAGEEGAADIHTIAPPPPHLA